MQVSGVSLAGPFEPLHEERRAAFLLVNGLVSDDNFDTAFIEFDALLPWMHPRSMSESNDDGSYTLMGFPREALAEGRLPDGSDVAISIGVAGQIGGDSVHLDRWCAFEVQGAGRAMQRVLNEWVRPLHDLLIVVLGRGVRMTALHVQVPNADRRANQLLVHFPATQPPPTAAPTWAQLANYDAPTLLRSESTDLGTLISNWGAVHQRRSEIVTLLCAPFYAPFIYSEHRYASTFQSAEGLARALVSETTGMREKEPSAHRARVEAVSTALKDSGLADEIVGWATRVLQGQNEKPLSQLITELVSTSGDLGATVLDAYPDFPKHVAWARAGVAHPGLPRTAALRRYWLGELLLWVMRVLLLHEAGVDLTILTDAALKKPSLRRALAETRHGTESS